MSGLSRRIFLRNALMGGTFLTSSVSLAMAEASSLADVGRLMGASLPVTVFVAREIITLDPARPVVGAVAVAGDRIVATGRLAM